MAGQVHKQRPKKEELAQENADNAPKVVHKSADELKSEMDEMLDIIDSVLDENEDLALKFIQKGGE